MMTVDFVQLMSLLHHDVFTWIVSAQDVQIHYGSWDSPDASERADLVVQLFHGVQRNHLDVFFLSLGARSHLER